MKKENFVTLLMSTISIILFGIGMCMCLLPEWNAFGQGIVIGGIGVLVLAAMLIIRRKMQNKPQIKLNAKSVGIALLGAGGALTLGVGMCMTMVWADMMLQGIIVGLVGIIALILLVPMCKGLK